MINKITRFMVLATLLSACSTSFKEKIGIVTTGPNEYKVQTNKALDVPPHYNLPEPKPANQKNSSSEAK